MICQRSIVQDIEEHLRRGAVLWVAYSGGLDSSVLLDLIATSTLNTRAKVIHVNHQLSQNSDAWEMHCREICDRYGLEIVCEKVQVKNRGEGIEHEARRQRYAIFERLLASGDLVLLAHHRSDLAETLFYRLMRGAGLRGLAAMPKYRRLGKGYLLRPLLDCAKNALEEYAATAGLSWVNDESNRDQRFDRNFLRHALFPKIHERWPGVESRLAATAAWAAEAESLLEEYAARGLRDCEQRTERFAVSISLSLLQRQSPAAQKNILRHWLRDTLGAVPSSAQFDEIKKLVDARSDAQPVLAVGSGEIRRFRQRLYLISKPFSQSNDAGVSHWDGRKVLALSDGSLLHCDYGGSKNLDLAIRYRTGKERCRPADRRHSQQLKKLLQEYALEPWLRDRVPLIFSDGELIAVGDLFVCAGVEEKLAGEICFRWGVNPN